MDDNLKDEIKVTLIATGLDGGLRRNKETSNDSLKRITPKFAQGGSSRQPSSYTSSIDDEDAIFSRKLKPGMGNIDVPSFFKPGK